ncbi:MAG: hypothetical protein JSW58_08295 [Candidatus Latescibacterota bacterium]|nr:MAG: hypothetical protein JSW58_08295 [Candidatus Latescibacterota bacterium]
MRKPIEAELYINYSPKIKLYHRALCFRGHNLDWPFLFLRRGNERLMMAWFEWGWRTIPAAIWVRDCGYSDAFSALLHYALAELCPPEFKTSRTICRRVNDLGV